MYTGFTTKYPINRLLTPREQEESLPRNAHGNANDHASIISYNSTYIDVVDRAFKMRGAFGTGLIAGGIFAMAIMLAVVIARDGWENYYLMPIIFIAAIATLFWFVFYNKELFTNTHYPIRFNRKNRTIYVFRSKARGGLLILPWESPYFHIGHGKGMDMLRDVRGEVMDGDTVKDTFAVGQFLGSNDSVRELWEFIRRYMDEGPNKLPGTQITLSMAPSWKNAYIMSAARTGILSDTVRSIFMPLIGLTTLTRFLVMKSCKPPIWPAEIEAACVIEPNDPYRLPEPAYIGQFSESDPHFEAKMRKLKQQQDERAERQRHDK